MLARFCFGFLPLLLAAVCTLGHPPVGPAAGPACCGGAAKVGEKKAQYGYICPLQKIAMYPTFCTYYAKVCGTTEIVPLDASCNLKYNGNECNQLPIPAPPCQAAHWKEDKEAGRYTADSLRSGVAISEVIVNPIPPASRKFTRLVGAPLIAQLEHPANTKVILHLLLVNPADAGLPGPPLLVGTGTQVRTRQDPDLEIPRRNIILNNRVATISLGSVNYRVLLARVDSPKEKEN